MVRPDPVPEGLFLRARTDVRLAVGVDPGLHNLHATVVCAREHSPVRRADVTVPVDHVLGGVVREADLAGLGQGQVWGLVLQERTGTPPGWVLQELVAVLGPVEPPGTRDTVADVDLHPLKI